MLAVRDPVKGERVAVGIDGDTDIRRLNLADLSSVRAFADAWTDSIDVLVNNAGIMAVPEARPRTGSSRRSRPTTSAISPSPCYFCRTSAAASSP